MTPVLSLKEISHAYHTPQAEIPVLSDISMEVFQGEFVSIVGPSGCGKSTLLSIINGLMKPDQGVLTLGHTTDDEKPVRIGYMLQRDQLFEWRTIWQNAILGLEIHHQLNDETKEKVLERLRFYDLYDFKDCYPSQLSGGMRQRVALVRTLALEPQLLLLDEPFSALDYQTRLTVSDDICTLIKRERRTALLVTHDLSEAISAADRILVLSKRPARIKADIPIQFENADMTPLMRRNSPLFSVYFNKIWKELVDYEQKQ
jgi:NitT/TauT family transport system ATP-binding protein